MNTKVRAQVTANQERKRSGAAGAHRDRRTRRLRTRSAVKVRAVKDYE